ncbi:unnamed protein product, partial [Prorocentrum cordatum]
RATRRGAPRRRRPALRDARRRRPRAADLGPRPGPAGALGHDPAVLRAIPVASAAVGTPLCTEGSRGELPAAPFSLVLYDARGHGGSSGWDCPGSSRPCSTQQFHWRALGVDMLFVADRHRSAGAAAGALLGGYSMGASSALWAAFLCPAAVRGLVLLSVTTAWEIRDGRRGSLIDIAEEHRRQGRLAAASVVLGAAAADLPPLEDIRAARMQMPALLAAAEDDPTHPAEVVERLAAALPAATLLLTDSTQELNSKFPEALRSWHRRHFSDPAG